MKKQELIDRIKSIIKTHGSFSTADIAEDSSITLNSMANICFELADEFTENGIETSIYVHDREEATSFVKYEDCTIAVLKQVLERCHLFIPLREILNA